MCATSWDGIRSRLDGIFFRRPDLKRASQGSVALDFEPDPAKSFSRGSTHYFLGRTGGRGRFARYAQVARRGGRDGCLGGSGVVRDERKDRACPGDGICFADETGELRGTYVNRTEDGRVYPNRMDGIGCGTAILPQLRPSFFGGAGAQPFPSDAACRGGR